MADKVVSIIGARRDGICPDREGFGIISPDTGRLIVSTVRSTDWACLLCFWRDAHMDRAQFDAEGYRCVPVNITVTESLS